MKFEFGPVCFFVCAFLSSFASASDQSSWMEQSKNIITAVAGDISSDKNLKQYFIDSIRLELGSSVSGIQITPVAFVIDTTSNSKYKNSCQIAYKIIPSPDQKGMKRVERISDTCKETLE